MQVLQYSHLLYLSIFDIFPADFLMVTQMPSFLLTLFKEIQEKN